MSTTIKAMKRVSEIKTKRERQHIKDRLASKAEEKKAQMVSETEKGIHLIKGMVPETLQKAHAKMSEKVKAQRELQHRPASLIANEDDAMDEDNE